ncbi:MAG: hypothetical protein M3Y56_15340 [Armatimonadota bacterium]|nr:hypothetical protein [Armatimonadota bacterium]
MSDAPGSEQPRTPEKGLAGYKILNPETPDRVMERVGFNYTPPEDPDDAEHRRNLEASRQKFQQAMAVTILCVVLLIALATTGTAAWIALKDPNAELRKAALTVLVSVISALIGAAAGWGGGKLLGGDEKKGKE